MSQNSRWPWVFRFTCGFDWLKLPPYFRRTPGDLGWYLALAAGLEYAERFDPTPEWWPRCRGVYLVDPDTTRFTPLPNAAPAARPT